MQKNNMGTISTQQSKESLSLKGPTQVLIFGLILMGLCYFFKNSDYKGDHPKLFKQKVHKSTQ